jgi:hypothetical protein
MTTISGWLAFVLLLGCLLGFAVSGAHRTAEAQGVDNKTTRWLAGTVSYGQAMECFVMFDSQTNRLMAYAITPGKELELVAVREISYDLKAVTFGKQKPPVQQMRDEWEKAEREEREKREKENKEKK